MKSTIALALLLSSLLASAAPVCTQASRETWMKAEEMKKKAVDMGYKIKTFKTLENCYEVIGTDAAGKKINVYFDPTTGAVVPSK